ncbi:hypothetical protein M9H77_07100 [Catharanthus roseus]|uniref:Uncharacterized protein n=1 Tax=Catharanthus roseus TaxID=4058 RepID=A0ACC0BTZ7_CATRO|nr:hypothetical protein M9H77_07100 [Catharanthus roseus]
MIEELSKVNELSQAQEEVEESIVIHIVEETSNEDSCDNMNEKSIEKEELVERLCILDSISIISKESEHFEVDECHLNISNYFSYVLGIEDKGSNMEKELSNYH